MTVSASIPSMECRKDRAAHTPHCGTPVRLNDIWGRRRWACSRKGEAYEEGELCQGSGRRWGNIYEVIRQSVA